MKKSISMIRKDFHIQYVEYSWEEFGSMPEQALFAAAHSEEEVHEDRHLQGSRCGGTLDRRTVTANG
ncbi:MAG: hypothetical protein R6V75_06040, partial [Bacteroidales bacterium]